MNKDGVQTGQSRQILALIFSCVVLTTVSSHKGPPEKLTSNDDVWRWKYGDESDGVVGSKKFQQPAENNFGVDSNHFRSDFRLIPVLKDLQRRVLRYGVSSEEKNEKEQWKKMKTRIENLLWQQLSKRKAPLQSKQPGYQASQRFKEFQRFARHYESSPPLTILQTMTPQFRNKIDPKLQRRLWQDVVVASKKKEFVNGFGPDDEVDYSGNNNHSSNNDWITMLKSEEPTNSRNPYQYEYDVQRPLNDQPQSGAQMALPTGNAFPEHAKKFQLNHHYRSK